MGANTVAGISAAFVALGQGIMDVFSGVWDYLAGWFSGIADWINGILEGLGLVTGAGASPPATDHNAEGGMVQAGMPTMVGERGPEMFIPQEAGRIMPASQSGGGGRDTSININLGGVTVRNESDMRTLSEMIATATRRELRAAGVNG
jgi:hypothetical protein